MRRRWRWNRLALRTGRPIGLTPAVSRGRWILRLEFQPRDVWFGAYWERRPHVSPEVDERLHGRIDVWVCVIPMLPLHIVRRAPIMMIRDPA